MELDQITTTLLQDTLRAWRSAGETPPGLLDLDILHDGRAMSRVERAIRLREWLVSQVTAELDRLRAAENISPGEPVESRSGLLAALGNDFKHHNIELEVWSALYHRFLVPVPLRAEELARAASLDARSFRRRVDAGLQRLTDRLQRLEMAEHDRRRRERLGRHLPPREYAALFGVAGLKLEIAGLLRRDSGPEVISIEGMGGIGKTALARAVANEMAAASELDGIAWVSARQTWFTDRGTIEDTPDAATSLADIVNRLITQLGYSELAGLSTADKLDRMAPVLKRFRLLIVIDNLESIHDLELLMPAMMPLAGPSRFLLTSRQSLAHYPAVRRFLVPSLSLAESRKLVESELERRDRPVSLTTSDMADMYRLIGGAPLALKLVAAQMSHWPLSVLVDDLRHARRSAPEQLYTFIYRRAWLDLDEPARKLLLSILHIAPDGEDIGWLQMMSFLPPDEFDRAMGQLLAASLLQVAGESDSLRYRIHRLTTTFLQTQVLAGWDAMGVDPAA